MGATVGLFLALVAVACSSAVPVPTGGTAPTPADGSGAPVSPAAPGSQADLEQAARDSFTAFLESDDQAYFDLLSRECREDLGFAAVESHLISRRQRAVEFGGVDLSAVEIASVTVTDLSPAGATVTLTLAGTDEEFAEGQPRSWTFEDGGWHLADCSDIGESPNDLEGRGTDRNAPLTLGEVVDISDWFVSLAHVNLDFEATVSPGEVEPAADGNQLVGAQFLVGYNGAEPSVVIGEHLAFAIASATTVYGDEAACTSELDGLFYDPTMQATPGENLPRPLVCRELPVSDLGGLLARVTDVPSGEEYWFDLGEE